MYNRLDLTYVHRGSKDQKYLLPVFHLPPTPLRRPPESPTSVGTELLPNWTLTVLHRRLYDSRGAHLPTPTTPTDTHGRPPTPYTHSHIRSPVTFTDPYTTRDTQTHKESSLLTETHSGPLNSHRHRHTRTLGRRDIVTTSTTQKHAVPHSHRHTTTHRVLTGGGPLWSDRPRSCRGVTVGAGDPVPLTP